MLYHYCYFKDPKQREIVEFLEESLSEEFASEMPEGDSQAEEDTETGEK